jgi:hypothetical protein
MQGQGLPCLLKPSGSTVAARLKAKLETQSLKTQNSLMTAD